MLSLILAALVAPAAHAAPQVISVETKTQRFANLASVNAKCSPGIAPNGHNFPTASIINLNVVYEVMPLANGRSIGVVDPQMRMGNHCAELMQEVAALLPGDITITRTIKQSNELLSGRCMRTIGEELEGTLGDLKLTDSTGFMAQPLADSECAR